MNVKLRTITLMMTGVLALTGCQTADLSKQTSKTINMPTVVVNVDSDGDGVPDELDQCPATPYNVVIDERGCPHSLLFGENEFMMEARAYYDENSSEIKSEYYEQLDNAGKKMQDHLDAVMRVEGHISKREETSANQTLSRYRVEGIKNYMIIKHNIDPDRIKTVYYGSLRLMMLKTVGSISVFMRLLAMLNSS